MADASRAFMSARGTLVVAASLLLLVIHPSAPSAAASQERVIVVGAEYAQGSAEVGYDSEDDEVRKRGQTFVAPRRGVKLASISLLLAGKGTAVVKVYETDKNAPLGKRLATLRTRVNRDKWYFLQVRPLIPMRADRRYSFVLSVKGGKTILGAGTGAGYDDGQIHCLCPTRIRGEKFDNDHWSWQSYKELGGLSEDLAFKLRFRRTRASLTSS